MKKLIFAASLLTAGIFATGSYVSAQAQAEKATTTVTGEIIDLQCFLDHGAHGDGHKACGTACAKAGNPIGILDAKGNVTLLLAADKHAPASTNEKLIDKMAQTVTVTGKEAKRGGLKAIVVDSIK